MKRFSERFILENNLFKTACKISIFGFLLLLKLSFCNDIPQMKFPRDNRLMSLENSESAWIVILSSFYFLFLVKKTVI